MNKARLRFLFAEVVFVGAGLEMFATGRFRDVSEAAHVPEWVPLIVLLIGLNAVVLMFRIDAFKPALLKGMQRGFTLRAAETNEFPQLDAHAFDRCDTRLTGLGFEPRFCYASEVLSTGESLVRLYYHPTHKCIATNGQIFQGKTRMVTGFIISQLDDNWALCTFNIKANPIQCMWRRPRALWNAIPGGEPRELLDAHLKIRQRMIDGLGVGNVTQDEEQQAWFERLIENHRQQCDALRNKNAVLLYLEYEFYSMKPIYTWMGDLEKAVRNR